MLTTSKQDLLKARMLIRLCEEMVAGQTYLIFTVDQDGCRGRMFYECSNWVTNFIDT
jgi:hypothetical protein